MRKLVIGVALLIGTTAGAATVTCKDGTTGTAGRGACSHHGGVAGTGSGTQVAPAAGPPARDTTATREKAPGTTVTCQDGTTGKAGRGACGHHGGVAKADAAVPAAPPVPPAPSAAPRTRSAASPPANAPTAMEGSKRGSSGPSAGTDPTGATARCKDGTYSHSQHHSGACSHHGGVAQWLDGQ